jgi:hypothetical protein
VIALPAATCADDNAVWQGLLLLLLLLQHVIPAGSKAD